MKSMKTLIKDTNGDAVVEAAILFPIIIMIFAGLVLASIYLPVRARLQNATQVAATAIATEMSDSFLEFNVNSMEYEWASGKNALRGNRKNVYTNLFGSVSSNITGKAEGIIRNMEKDAIGYSADMSELKVEPVGIVNYFIYKEVIVTATRTIDVHVDLSFVGFPSSIPITVTSTAVAQNGDEFVRTMDLTVHFVKYLSEKLGFDVSKIISNLDKKITSFLGWNRD